jgi:hypothetical protein
MNKRAQVTLFVIIAIVIFVGVTLFFVFNGKNLFSDSQTEKEYSELKNYIQDCLDITLLKVVSFNSLQGGYYFVEGRSLVYEDEEDFFSNYYIPYYLIDNKENLPSEEKLKEEISLGVEKELIYCLNFSGFEYDVSYDYEKIESVTKLSSEKISISLELPFRVLRENNSSISFEEFYSEIDSSFYELYLFSRELTNFQKNNENNLCLSCLVEESERFGYNLTLNSLIDEDSYVLINTVIPSEEAIIYNFAYKFSEEENE